MLRWTRLTQDRLDRYRLIQKCSYHVSIEVLSNMMKLSGDGPRISGSFFGSAFFILFRLGHLERSGAKRMAEI